MLNMNTTITDKVREVSEQQLGKFREDDNFNKLEEFYKHALERGSAKKPEYNLPQMDTIGIVFTINNQCGE